MAAPGDGVGGFCKHHAQQGVCDSRAKYREGRRPRAVKVYTVNLESRYLLIQGVPALGVMKELVQQFALYGAIEEYNALDEYPAEQFTEVYLIKFQKLQSARIAKRKMDERSFFGSLLHVCYAPEFETVQETREKLQDRRKYIAKATSNRVLFIAKKIQEPKKTASKNLERCFQPETLGVSAADASTSNWDPSARCPYPYKPSCEFSSRNTACPSGDHFQSAMAFPQYVNNSAETSEYNSQSKPLTNSAQERGRTNSPVSLVLQRKVPSDNGIGRFMPRTTQLQERKRKRDQSNQIAFIGTDSDSSEIIIGPRLPEIPKVDMDDDSLNTSASLIRNKLNKVSVTVPKTSGEKPEDSQTKPPIKQRRRI
uniref:RNA-binding protein 48 n=1 Tax=Pelodiscus sinensis TaxID=13735 RepID=K7FT11_PELSI|nr:RNA-binding protein 48 [Pelodiscus sinensis]|eukprot:XP_006114537.1 RNA-binding protein 48 [Pelodiscus sinensis]